MIRVLILVFALLLRTGSANGQIAHLKQISLDGGIVAAIDEPEIDRSKPTKLIFFALPNGNSIAQTFGKKLAPGDDWHFGIQHIGAQTAFVRALDTNANYIVIYLANRFNSWPACRKAMGSSNSSTILNVVNTLAKRYRIFKPTISFTSHSGGGSFIFGFIEGVKSIPGNVKMIGFLDANYAYDSNIHFFKLKRWLRKRDKQLQVVAYNDSVVVYNGKPLVSPTGGTWYRSKLMARDLGLRQYNLGGLMYYLDKRATVILIPNPDAKIFHTVMVERNGFIQLLLKGTCYENQGYRFWGEPAYSGFVKE